MRYSLSGAGYILFPVNIPSSVRPVVAGGMDSRYAECWLIVFIE